SDGLVSRTRTSARVTCFMVPKHGIKVVGALPELSAAPPGFGVRQRRGAVQDAAARFAGSWSQCMRESERRRSVNLGTYMARSARKISERHGMDACAPGRVTEIEAAAMAKRIAYSCDSPSATAAANAPEKQSPAP